MEKFQTTHTNIHIYTLSSFTSILSSRHIINRYFAQCLDHKGYIQIIYAYNESSSSTIPSHSQSRRDSYIDPKIEARVEAQFDFEARFEAFASIKVSPLIISDTGSLVDDFEPKVSDGFLRFSPLASRPAPPRLNTDSTAL